MILSFFLALIGLQIVCSISESCNGSPDYCELPIAQYVWPGTHNSGSSLKVCPSASSFLVEQARCALDNHEKDYQEQLDHGVRYLKVDICAKNSVVINCHGTSLRTEGESISASLQTVKSWLEANTRDVVVWAIDNDPDNVDSDFEDVLTSIFGACLSTKSSVESRGSNQSMPLACLRWHGILETSADLASMSEVTLGRAIDANLRLLYGPECCGRNLGYTYSENSGSDVPNLENHLDQVAKGLVPGIPKDGHTSLAADVFWTSSSLVCRESPTQTINEAMLLSDASLPSFLTDSTTCGNDGNCQCVGYRTQIEVMQQTLFGRGMNLAAVLVDYSKYGDLNATIRRLNEASLRRFRGQPEPCLVSSSTRTSASPATTVVTTSASSTTKAISSTMTSQLSTTKESLTTLAFTSSTMTLATGTVTSTSSAVMDYTTTSSFSSKSTSTSSPTITISTTATLATTVAAAPSVTTTSAITLVSVADTTVSLSQNSLGVGILALMTLAV